MSFPAYPEYRDSGVAWLGEVPAHWGVGPLKRTFAIIGGTTPKADNPEFWDGGIPWATPTDLGSSGSFTIFETGRTISEAGLASCGTTIVPAGSVILSTRAPIGSLGIAGVPLCTNQGCKSLVPLGDDCPSFFAQLLSVSTAELKIRGSGSTFLELSGDKLGVFQVPVPPPAEQAAIAAFLDRETGKIDALVEEQRRLIALLKEKRQAVISHAVTKGLNPQAPLKPSGIEWLGDVPAHWDVRPVKYDLQATTGGSSIKGASASEAAEGLYQGFSASGPDVWLDDFQFECDGIVLSAVGARCGKTFRASGRWGAVANTHCLFPKADGVRDFWWYVTNREDWWEKGGTAQPFVKVSDTLARKWPVPPPAEQAAIAAFLDRETGKIDALVREAEHGTFLLQERRAALISAAVTGKIDVRGLVATPGLLVAA